MCDILTRGQSNGAADKRRVAPRGYSRWHRPLQPLDGRRVATGIGRMEIRSSDGATLSASIIPLTSSYILYSLSVIRSMPVAKRLRHQPSIQPRASLARALPLQGAVTGKTPTAASDGMDSSHNRRHNSAQQSIS